MKTTTTPTAVKIGRVINVIIIITGSIVLCWMYHRYFQLHPDHFSWLVK